ncbi:PP2C family protein-serine/threonine phosphatase [Streptomyces sp. E11-3]|uniref:PP2C family protein-serine/threonine phosphatase n=1 Tax=Streptomyces sp. E11-3 TaxID=3110112 RepID=UPI003981009C
MSPIRHCLTSVAAATGIAVTDILLGHETVLSGLLVLGPLLACARLPTRLTAAVGWYVIVLFVVLSYTHHTLGMFNSTVRLLALAISVGMAVYIAHVRTARERTLATLARTTQQALLQPMPPRVGDLLVATRYRCATRDLVLGGDVFDAVHSSHGVRVLIADVRGSGLGATVTAAATLRYFRDAAYTQRDLSSVAGALNAGVSRQLGPEDFVTATLAEFTPDGRVTVVNCGHHPPAVLGDQGAHLLTVDPALPLGMRGDHREQSVLLAPGERMLFYTDGLAEARNHRGAMFDLEAELRVLPYLPLLDDVLDDLLKRMDSHTGGDTSDDVALVLCQPGFSPASGGPA